MTLGLDTFCSPDIQALIDPKQALDIHAFVEEIESAHDELHALRQGIRCRCGEALMGIHGAMLCGTLSMEQGWLSPQGFCMLVLSAIGGTVTVSSLKTVMKHVRSKHALRELIDEVEWDILEVLEEAMAGNLVLRMQMEDVLGIRYEEL